MEKPERGLRVNLSEAIGRGRRDVQMKCTWLVDRSVNKDAKREKEEEDERVTRTFLLRSFSFFFGFFLSELRQSGTPKDKSPWKYKVHELPEHVRKGERELDVTKKSQLFGRFVRETARRIERGFSEDKKEPRTIRSYRLTPPNRRARCYGYFHILLNLNWPWTS